MVTVIIIIALALLTSRKTHNRRVVSLLFRFFLRTVSSVQFSCSVMSISWGPREL